VDGRERGSLAGVSYSEIGIAARRALLDALVALRPHRDALVLVGSQAIYLYTGDADVPIATTTKDSDIAVLPQMLRGHPLLDDAMEGAGFHRDLQGLQGQWFDRAGTPVELLVPAALEPSGKRGARIPPHDNRSALRVSGLEAAAVDRNLRVVTSLDPDDKRTEEISVAGPAALLVAKAHKIGDRVTAREAGSKDRTQPKDAHDVFRLLQAVSPDAVPTGLELLLAHEVSATVTRIAIERLRRLAATPEAELCALAGRAEEGVGAPALVSAQVHALIADALEGLG